MFKIICILLVISLYFLMFIAGWLSYENKQINELLKLKDNIGNIANEGLNNDKC